MYSIAWKCAVYVYMHETLYHIRMTDFMLKLYVVGGCCHERMSHDLTRGSDSHVLTALTHPQVQHIVRRRSIRAALLRSRIEYSI